MGDDRFREHERADTGGDRERLDEFDARLRAARQGSEPPAKTSTQRETAFAYRVLIEMIVGVGFGAFAGWWLDTWLGTRPVLMVVMIVLGFAAGAVNAYRASREYSAGLDERGRE